MLTTGKHQARTHRKLANLIYSNTQAIKINGIEGPTKGMSAATPGKGCPGRRLACQSTELPPRPCDTEESSPAGLVSCTLPRTVRPSFVILPENGPSGNCLVRPRKQHEHQIGDNPGRERTSPTLGVSSGPGDHSTPITCQPGAPPEHKHSQSRTTSQGGPSLSV